MAFQRRDVTRRRTSRLDVAWLARMRGGSGMSPFPFPQLERRTHRLASVAGRRTRRVFFFALVARPPRWSGPGATYQRCGRLPAGTATRPSRLTASNPDEAILDGRQAHGAGLPRLMDASPL